MNVAEYIDHAVLKPTCTDGDLKKECEVAKKFEVASVCVKPYHVKLAKECLKGSVVEVGTVIGFPHGSSTTQTKIFETREAIENGATEVDIVVNIAKVLEEDFKYVEQDIREVIDTAHSKDVIVKIIFETCFLNDEQKIKLCKLCSKLEADYVKTSTGFGTNGATLKDIKLFRENVSNGVKIKASGGIKTLDQAKEFINIGCQRLGLSSTKDIL